MRWLRLTPGLLLMSTGAARAQTAAEAEIPPSDVASPSVAPTQAAPPPQPAPVQAPSPASPGPGSPEFKAAVKAAIAEYEVERSQAAHARTIHNHDGGYFRFGLNLGYAFDRAELSGVTTRSRGFGVSLDSAVGLNASESWVVGIGIHGIRVPSPTTKVDGVELGADHTSLYSVVGLLLDYYPDPHGGLHFNVTFGSGDARIHPDSDEATSSGLGLAFGAGYDFWVAEQWSLGATGRLLTISGSSDKFGDHSAVIPTLALTALLH